VAVDAWHNEGLHVFANERQVALVAARDQVLGDPYLQLGWQGEEVRRGLTWVFGLATVWRAVWRECCHRFELVAVARCHVAERLSLEAVEVAELSECISERVEMLVEAVAMERRLMKFRWKSKIAHEAMLPGLGQ
jgi:hypothetical protein